MPPTKQFDAQLFLSLRSEDAELIKKLAQIRRVSISAYLREIVEDHLSFARERNDNSVFDFVVSAESAGEAGVQQLETGVQQM